MSVLRKIIIKVILLVYNMCISLCICIHTMCVFMHTFFLPSFAESVHKAMSCLDTLLVLCQIV